METAPPFPVVSGQRQLAVIMFTDAVGYSAKMHEQEVATLNRIERDAETQRRFVAAHDGTVIKSTGDGLMIQFASAVQAVACALEIQRHFAGRNEPGVAITTLRYRIGIHLGDVFIGGGDVMGDGVNIAARLVNEALPGGITISQHVFEVVKNKLPLHAVRLGPQHLKNIKEPVVLYRVFAEPPATPVAPAPTAGTPAVPAPPVPSTTPPRSRRPLLVLLVLVAVAAGAYLLWQQHLAHETDLAQSQSAQAALGQAMRAASDSPVEKPGTPASDDEPVLDFRALTTAVPARARPDEPAARIVAAEAAVRELEEWLPAALARFTRDRPLVVSSSGRTRFPAGAVYSDGTMQLYFAEGGAQRKVAWAELKEPVQAAVIVGVLRNANPPAPIAVRRGAAAFAYLHGLPDMAQELQP